jgi:hypothetical protein
LDRMFHEQICRFAQVSVPKSIKGVERAYQIDNDAFNPALKFGDIICCSEITDSREMWPELAVVGFACGYVRLTYTRPTRPIHWAARVKFIIRA